MNTLPSFDRVDRSELVRLLLGLLWGLPAGDCICEGVPDAVLLGLPGYSCVEGPKKELGARCKPGLTGEVAMGLNMGSTVGLVTAVCRAVKNRRGPAGLGTTITSGSSVPVAA